MASDGRTPQEQLYRAAHKGDEETIVRLLTPPATSSKFASVDINEVDKVGWSALYWAASAGHAHVTHLLLRGGIEEQEIAAPDGVEPIVTASATADAATVAAGALIELHSLKGAPELNGRTGTIKRWNATQERWAVRLDGEATLRSLRAANLNVTRAAPPPPPPLSRTKADPNATGDDNETALMAAAYRGHLEVQRHGE
jgi:ankyrin repeat protein